MIEYREQSTEYNCHADGSLVNLFTSQLVY